MVEYSLKPMNTNVPFIFIVEIEQKIKYWDFAFKYLDNRDRIAFK